MKAKRKKDPNDTTAYDRKLYRTSAATRAEVAGWPERRVTVPKERYSVDKRLNDGLRNIADSELDETRLWTTVKLRKQRDCCVCSFPIMKGEQAWSPITNGSNRYHRAHGECFA